MPAPKKSEIVAFLNRAAMLMRVQLPSERASALADFIIEQQFPASLFNNKTLASLVASFSEHFPSAQHLAEHLTKCLENQNRERQQRGTSGVDRTTMRRLVWAHKVLERPPLYGRPYTDDATRVAKELRDKYPDAYAKAANLDWKDVPEERRS